MNPAAAALPCHATPSREPRKNLPAVIVLPADTRCTCPADLSRWGADHKAPLRPALVPQVESLARDQHEAITQAADRAERAVAAAEALAAIEPACGSAREEFYLPSDYETSLLTSDDR